MDVPQFISLNNDDLIAGSDDDYGADFHLSSPPRLEHDMEMAEAAGLEPALPEVAEAALPKVAEAGGAAAGQPSKRIKQKNLHVNPSAYVQQQQAKNTTRATEYAVRLFNEVMPDVALANGFEYKELLHIPMEELPDRLAKFFMVIRRNDGSSYNASTLESIYGSIARFLATEFTPKLDIKKDLRFDIVKKNVKSAQKESCADGERPGKHKAKPFKDEHIAKCWEEKLLGRHSPKALVTTVHFAMLHNFGSRANFEPYNVKNIDLVYGQIGKDGVPDKMELSERITKTRRGGQHDIRDWTPAIYADKENPDTCPVRTMMEFQRRKSPMQRNPEGPFYLSIKQSAERFPDVQQFWFTNQRMGEHTIAKLLPSAFDALEGVDSKQEKYSNSSARKSLMEGGVEAGVPEVLLSKVAGHASLDTIKNYVKGRDNAQKAVSLTLSRKMAAKGHVKYSEVCDSIGDAASSSTAVQKFPFPSLPQLPLASPQQFPFTGQQFTGQPQQLFAGQQFTGQQFPGQQFPGQQFPGQPQQFFAGQQFTGQQFPGQQFPGQQFPGLQFTGQPQLPFAGQQFPFAGQQFSFQGQQFSFPGQQFSFPGQQFSFGGQQQLPFSPAQQQPAFARRQEERLEEEREERLEEEREQRLKKAAAKKKKWDQQKQEVERLKLSLKTKESELRDERLKKAAAAKETWSQRRVTGWFPYLQSS
jgi:hypothetical protein